MATERGSLGLGQRVLLLGAWLVSCGFVYVLGVYVGKGMRGGGEITPRVALPVDVTAPPPPPSDAQAPLTFYDVLGARDGAAPAARTAPPVAAAKPSALSEERLAPLGAAPAPSPAGSSETAKAASSPAPGAPPTAAEVKDTAPPTPVVVPIAKPLSPLPPSESPALPPTASGGSVPGAPAAPLPQAASGRWTVYATPTRDRLAVEHERAALRAKGYPAEVVTLRRDGDMWYRIRVGRYATQAQAEEASRRLRTDGVGHAFVQSE